MRIAERISKIGNPANFNYDCFGNIQSPGDSFRNSDKPYIICSISGGRSSGLMAYILQNSEIYKSYEKIYVFMNTGREDVRTIKFLKDIQDYVIKRPINIIETLVNHCEKKSSGYAIKDFTNLSMNGEPFEEVIKKYGLPSVEYLHCSRELKINPINAFIRDHLKLSKNDFRQAIGIRLDEVRRYTCNPDFFIYPLIDFHIRKSHVNEFWNEDQFKQYDIGANIAKGWDDFEGNCDFCYKKSSENLVKMFNKNPEKLDWWTEMEETYGNGYPIYRNHKSTMDIRNDTMEPQQQLDCLCGNSQLTFFDS